MTEENESVMREIHLKNHTIGEEHEIFIVAEVGTTCNGNINTAKIKAFENNKEFYGPNMRYYLMPKFSYNLHW